MNIQQFLLMITLGMTGCTAIAVLLEAGSDYLEDKRHDRKMIEASARWTAFAKAGELPLELYGPPEDRMEFGAFLDFWMLMTPRQKWQYTQQQWSQVA